MSELRLTLLHEMRSAAGPRVPIQGGAADRTRAYAVRRIQINCLTRSSHRRSRMFDSGQTWL